MFPGNRQYVSELFLLSLDNRDMFGDRSKNFGGLLRTLVDSYEWVPHSSCVPFISPDLVGCMRLECQRTHDINYYYFFFLVYTISYIFALLIL